MTTFIERLWIRRLEKQKIKRLWKPRGLQALFRRGAEAASFRALIRNEAAWSKLRLHATV